ncbi:phosphatase PAP2 family protein [Salarchaeum sp. JOR-1]|uniref:phosphatase PAP2 family protein n=1 Tax=Salarchaeum sp. JOR-1 TaxID=2599399 RepID=UPI00119841FC|nr:phosphatase PAP2 family protein [Salarchaeum sp. JOR-1]QDX41083.1 phosphatase PAP2 family protein [Salarchaeum sp. JOR-1]
MLALSPVDEYMLAVTAATVLGLLASAAVFLPRSPAWYVREFLRTDWKYLGAAWLVAENLPSLAEANNVEQTFTDAVYAVEGGTVAAVQSVASPPLTWAFVAFYLVVFPVLVPLTYFALKSYASELDARRYAVSYVLVVLLATPFFVRTPVSIPALYPPAGVDPLVFVTPEVEAGMLATDSMLKAFPSLHTGLSVLAALYARKTIRLYALSAGVSAAVIVVSTFYLGMHWLVDAAAAIVLAGLAYALAHRIPPEAVLPFPGYRRLAGRLRD